MIAFPYLTLYESLIISPQSPNHRLKCLTLHCIMKPPTCAILLPFFVGQLCKMPLIVRPVEYADVPQCVVIRIATLGSLVIGRPPPYAGYQQEQEASVKFDLDNKPHVHHLKVVDPDNEQEVLAYAKWEVYPEGRPDLDRLSQPMDPEDKTIDQFGLLREAAHEYFCQRNGEMGMHPHICEFKRLRHGDS